MIYVCKCESCKKEVIVRPAFVVSVKHRLYCLECYRKLLPKFVEELKASNKITL